MCYPYIYTYILFITIYRVSIGKNYDHFLINRDTFLQYSTDFNVLKFRDEYIKNDRTGRKGFSDHHPVTLTIRRYYNRARQIDRRGVIEAKYLLGDQGDQNYDHPMIDTTGTTDNLTTNITNDMTATKVDIHNSNKENGVAVTPTTTTVTTTVDTSTTNNNSNNSNTTTTTTPTTTRTYNTTTNATNATTNSRDNTELELIDRAFDEYAEEVRVMAKPVIAVG